MALDWSNLTSLTGNRPFTVSRVTLTDNHVAIEGEFELPPMARLSYDDQVFVAEFIRSHIIRVTETAFDDFAAGAADEAANRRALGLDR